MSVRRGVALALALAQVVGCGGCVKDEPVQSEPDATGARKPIDLRAADKRFTQFSEAGAHATDATAATDAATD